MLGIKDLRQHITKYVNDILGLYALNLIQLLVIALSEASGICSGRQIPTSAKFWSRNSAS